MNETAVVCWYGVRKCGYYASSRAKVPEFGSMQGMLNDLKAWSRDKQLGETQTIGEAAAEAEGAEQLPVYLMDVRGDDDDFLVTLWNQTPSVEGQVASIRPDDVVGRADVVMNDLAAGTIPGFATYFYFVPSRSAVAAVRFQHPIFGHLPMRRYMSGFLRHNTGHVVWSDEPGPDGTLEILGYAEGNNEPPRPLTAYFKSELLKQEGERDEVERRAADITRIARKTMLSSQRRPDRAFFQRALSRFGLSEPPPTPPSVKLMYEMSVRLTAEQVKEIADAWEESASEGEDWDDIGFRLRGEQGFRWLSKSVARVKLDLDVTRDSTEVVNAQSLLAQLKIHRDAITAAIKS